MLISSVFMTLQKQLILFKGTVIPRLRHQDNYIKL